MIVSGSCTAQWLAAHAVNGDALGVQSRGAVGIPIRGLTASNWSHVALVYWRRVDGRLDLWVAEMKEGIGFRRLPVLDWMNGVHPQALVYLAEAPRKVRGREEIAELIDATAEKPPAYGYLSLLSVWVSQLIRRRVWHRGLVCSTWAQRIWERSGGGWRFSRTMDPGDFLEVSPVVRRVERF